MCSITVIRFFERNLNKEEVKGKSVIEVGSLDVNGSVRPLVERFWPARYVGVDIAMGEGVDEICDANHIVERFGSESFDILISTELLEHVRDWRGVTSNFKHILKPEGLCLITTRSCGFGYHGYPFDFWRYEVSDMKVIFSDCIIEKIERDTRMPGVFVKLRKPSEFSEKSLDGYALFSIIKRKRVITIRDWDLYFFKLRMVAWRLLSRYAKGDGERGRPERVVLGLVRFAKLFYLGLRSKQATKG